jgi:hypothetical protein
MPRAENGSTTATRDSTTTRRLKALSAHAERYFGAISWTELLAIGFSAAAIGRLVDRGTLVPITHGVYAIGHRHLTREGWWSVAVRVGGDQALLSHRAGCAVRGLLRPTSTTDIIVSEQQGRELDLIRSHRCDVDPVDRALVHGLPTTSLPLSLLDLAGREPRRLVEALEQALILELYDHEEMLAVIGRYRGRRGVARLRAAIEVLPDDPARFRSRVERRARDLLTEAGLPEPEINAWYVAGAGGGHELDLYWPALQKNADIDGPRHDLPWQKASDRIRDAELRARGVAVQRHRVELVDHAPQLFVAEIQAFLAESG